MNEEETQYTCPERPEKPVLYVVFHGEIVLIDYPYSDFITVQAPHMDEHVYMAGPWLGENEIPQGSQFVLNGVLRGGATIHGYPDKFVLFTNVPGNPGAQPHFDICLPRPKQILPGQVLSFPPDTVEIQTAGVGFELPDGQKTPTALDLHPVFVYGIDPGAKGPPGLSVRSPGAPQLSWQSREGCPGYYSLHIFAEADQDRGPQHVAMALTAAAALLGVDAMAKPLAPYQSVVGPVNRVKGLLSDEIGMPLRVRNETLQNMGAALRRGDPPVWDPPQFLKWFTGGDCGPIGA